MFASPVGFDENGNLPQYFDTLLNYPNIHLRTLNLWRFAQNTPISEWIKQDKLFESPYLLEQMSDILRAVTLFKYGGFYLDMDVVVKKSFDNLEENIIGDDWFHEVSNAVLYFNNYGAGANFLHKYLT